MTPPPEQIAAGELGCFAQIALLVTAWTVLLMIEAFVGWDAALWFSAGFIVAALVAFWEAARNRHLLEKDRDDG